MEFLQPIAKTPSGLTRQEVQKLFLRRQRFLESRSFFNSRRSILASIGASAVPLIFPSVILGEDEANAQVGEMIALALSAVTLAKEAFDLYERISGSVVGENTEEHKVSGILDLTIFDRRTQVTDNGITFGVSAPALGTISVGFRDGPAPTSLVEKYLQCTSGLNSVSIDFEVVG